MLPGDVTRALRFEGPVRKEAEESGRVSRKEEESPHVYNRAECLGSFTELFMVRALTRNGEKLDIGLERQARAIS